MPKKVIALDYGMRKGKATVTVRRALLYYALKRLGLDTDAEARTPQNQQIVLINRDEVIGAVPLCGHRSSQLTSKPCNYQS